VCQAVLRDAVRETEEEKAYREDLNRYPENGGERVEKRLTPGRLHVRMFVNPRTGKTNPKTTDGILSFRGERGFSPHPKEVGEMKKIACILLAAVTLWLVIVFIANGMAKITMSASSRAYSWVSKEKLRSLARHHGTDALKITELEVFIRRDRDWIPVLKKKQI
jgi:hypothetical protein